MTELKVKGYATYDKLKTCIVGRTYDREQFQDIKNIDLTENQFIFHAGTIEKKNKIFSNGGRVLNFVSLMP